MTNVTSNNGTVYTHGFTAHADELLATALVKAVYPEVQFKVIRVKAETELPEVLGENDYIVDIGGVYDGKQRFDHHQDDEEVYGECAASLVAKALCPDLATDYIWGSFLQRVALQDNKGIEVMKNHYGLQDPNIFMVLERGLTRLFEQDPDTASDIVAAMATDRLDFFKDKAKGYTWLQTHASLEQVDTPRGSLMVLVLDEDPRDEGIAVPAMNAAQTEYLRDYSVKAAATYSFDPRSPKGAVRTLYRTKDGTGILDFTKAKPGDCKYQDKRGFLLNFAPVSPDEYRELLLQSLV